MMTASDRIGGAVLLIVGLVALWESAKLPLGSLRNPGPAFMPLALAVIVLGCGALLVVFGGASGAFGRIAWTEWRHAVAIFAACAFAAWGLERLGYRLTITATLVFLLAVVERKGALTTGAFALGLAFGSFYMFSTLLRVPLPRGPWGL